MAYLVDGNNVMGRRVGWHKDKTGARRQLMSDLAQFARIERAKVAVVFDGAPDEHFPDGSSFMGVRVLYGARGSNADERIKHLVDEERERRTLVVVTSDRQLADYVRRSGVRVVRAGEFDKRLLTMKEGEKTRSSNKDDLPTLSHDELLKEMRYFGVGPEDE